MNRLGAPSPFVLGVVLLAAGASSRMGRPKLLLPWGKTSVLGHLLETWQSVGAAQVAVVAASGDQGMLDALNRLGFPSGNRILNPVPQRGMFSSIQCAAQWAGWSGNLTHWVIALGDQPHLRRRTLQHLLDFGRAHPRCICQPAWEGRPQHPVLLPSGPFLELATWAEQGTLREFLQAHPTCRLRMDCSDPGLALDMDHPSDYEQAKNRFFSEPES